MTLISLSKSILLFIEMNECGAGWQCTLDTSNTHIPAQASSCSQLCKLSFEIYPVTVQVLHGTTGELSLGDMFSSSPRCEILYTR